MGSGCARWETVIVLSTLLAASDQNLTETSLSQKGDSPGGCIGAQQTKDSSAESQEGAWGTGMNS